VENYGQSIEIKKQQLESLEASVDSATKLFQNARAEYMDVLLAQRDLMEARMVLIETKQQQLSAIVNAYQALGGGGLPTDQYNLVGGLCCPLPPVEDIYLQQPLQIQPGVLPPPSMRASRPEQLPEATEILP
jgi:outer membrane protein, multidrug efflux system